MRGRTTRVLSAGLVASALAGGGAALAATPVSGSIAGPVTSVSGPVFKIKTSLSPTGTSTVHVTSSTRITAQKAAGRADLVKGLCATAIGTRKGKTTIAASRIMLSQPMKGSCNPFAGRWRPGSAPPPPGENAAFANFGVAAGTIATVEGSTLTIHDRTGSTSVMVSAKTQLVERVKATASAIRLELCAFVQGRSADKGVTVQAQRVALSPGGANGCRFGGRR